MILERKRTSRHEVLPVFYDVDPSQVRKQMGSFEEAFTRHHERFELETGETKTEWKRKVEGWTAALREVANIAGMNLQNKADGHESKFIKKIVKVVGEKLSRRILDIGPHLIGIHSRSKDINLWLQDDSTGVGIVAICGMGGIGKTTIAKYLYNLNFSRFECSSFLANVREISKQQDGLLRLQEQLLSDLLKGRMEKVYSVEEGIGKIKDAICCKRVLVVLDDVDKLDQLDAVLGMRDWLFSGSKIIITTRHERLQRAHEVYKLHRIDVLNYDESLELFSWHAFGQKHPIDGYVEDLKRVVHHCGGLPLAIKILGSSLSGRSINVWKSQLEKLKAIPDSEILEKLKISYDSLQDDHDKNLFLHVACFFVGKDKDHTVTILDECDFYTMVGIQNLIDRCLLAIGKKNKLEMHQLLQEMGKEVVRRESPKEPGERSRLCNHKDSFNVLRENTGTRKIEGLILDMHLVKDDKYVRANCGVNRKRRWISYIGNPLKRYHFDIFSWHPVDIAPGNSNQASLKADAFASMSKIKLLQLRNVQLSGSYEKFPKELRWMCWHGFPLQSIPNDFPLERLVVLEMPYSSLKVVWNGTKFLELLKILNLSHSHNLAETPDFSMLPNLERLILENCARLIEVHESIGHLERLFLLNLRDCKKLRKLPGSIGLLKLLETFDVSGCSNLEKFPIELRNMESLTVLNADGIDMNRLLSATGEVKAWHSFIWPRKSPEISWASSLPRSLVRLSLAHCNLSDDAFPWDLSNLSSLRVLSLSNNPICSLPDCIKGLTGLQELDLSSCTRLRSLTGLQELEELWVGKCSLLEKVTFLSPHCHSRHTCYNGCYNLVEFMGDFKLEPIENADPKIINNLGLSNFGSSEKPNVKLVINFVSTESREFPLQVCYEDQRNTFYAYLPGSKVPAWFEFQNTGSSVSFTVPSFSHDDDLNLKIGGLSVCSVYGISKNANDWLTDLQTIISNITKSLEWSHWPWIYGIPEADEDMIWLSYWKLENDQLEAGDEVTISVVSPGNFQVKEVGVHLVHEEEQEEESTQQIYPYANVVPENVSAHPANTKVYGYYPHYRRGV